MNSFLSEVAARILKEHPDNTDKVAVVFNNRRPGLFLSRYLGKMATKPIFLPKMMGMDDMGDLRTSPSYDLFLRHYLGFADPVHTGHTELARSFAAQKAVQQMPVYPRAGSVKVIGGALVVKLNETQLE